MHIPGRGGGRRLAALAAVGMALGGCTGDGHVTAPGESAVTVLGCRDSAGQQADQPSTRFAGGIESPALYGDTNADDSLPRWKSRDGFSYLVWKVFLAVAPTARPYRTVSVVSPASDRLVYASPARWGSESNASIVPVPSRRVRLPVCGRQFTGYTGGILVRRPACVTLAVTGPAVRRVTVTVPILVTHC